MPGKKCRTCQKLRPESSFPLLYPNKICLDCPRDSVCTACHTDKQHNKARKTRNRNLFKTHRLRYSDFERMYDIQRGCCAICGKNTILLLGRKRDLLVIDHDHTTGHIRGLLCNSCNLGLGLFHDNLTLLKRAILYLDTARQHTTEIPAQQATLHEDPQQGLLFQSGPSLVQPLRKPAKKKPPVDYGKLSQVLREAKSRAEREYPQLLSASKDTRFKKGNTLGKNKKEP